MRNIIILLAAMMSLGASCDRNTASLSDNDGCTFRVGMPEQGTKVAIGDKQGDSYPLTWETGDRLIVNHQGLTNALDESYAGKREAIFTTTDKFNYPILLVYPHWVKGGNDYILLPAESEFTPGTLQAGVMIANVLGSEKKVSMQHSCGYVKVPVTGSATLTEASITALGGEYIAGRFTVNTSNATLSHADSPSSSLESSSSVTLKLNCTLSSEPSELMFMLPAADYASGFRVSLRDSEGKQMSATFGTASGKQIKAGIISEMPTLEYSASSPETEQMYLSKTSLNFPSRQFQTESVKIITAQEEVNVSCEGIEWLKCDLPQIIPAQRTFELKMAPQSGNVSEHREGKIILSGAKSGTVKEISVSQNSLYTATDGFPALWEIFSDTCVTDGTANDYAKTWTSEGIAPVTNRGNTAGTGYISAGSPSGRTLRYSIDASSSTKTLCVGGMGENDYILFSVPAISIPAGTDFDFMITLNATTNSAPKYWLFEYWDGGEWKHDTNRLYTAQEDKTTKYSFYIKHFSSANHRTFIQSFTLQNGIENDFVRMRIRAVGNINGSGTTLKPTATAYVYFATMTYQACNIVCYKDAPAIKDTTRLMQLGNSFTYYFGSAFKLKEMCRRNGHQTDVRLNLKGSQEFEHHMNDLVFSQEVVEEGKYAKAIIQDGSYFHAEYGAGSASAISGVTVKYTPEQILQLTKEMSAEIRKYSPSAEIILESVWSYSRKAAGDNYLGFGDYATFDSYQWKGSTEIASACENINWLSPIGKAFANARNNYGFTQAYNYLNHTDNYHDSREGAYLKACVNYLILFGEDFPANAPDCDLPADVAAKLRQAAKDIVLSDRNSFRFH